MIDDEVKGRDRGQITRTPNAAVRSSDFNTRALRRMVLMGELHD